MRLLAVPSRAGDWPDRGVWTEVAFLELSVLSVDKALGVWGGVFFVRGGAASSVSFAFSKFEAKEDCAERAFEALVGVVGELDACSVVGLEM